MRKFILLYAQFIRLSFRGAMAHRSQYWAGIIAQWLSYGTRIAVLFIMVNNFDVLAGWTADEMVFMYSFDLLAYSLCAFCLFGPSTGLAAKVRSGEFDSALTKPLSPFVHELYTSFNPGYVSHVSLTVVMLIVTGIRLKLSFSPLGLLVFLAMLAGAVLVQAAELNFCGAAGFFIIGENFVFDAISTTRDFTRYPITIYPAAVRFILTFVIPVAFMNFYPASVILGRGEGMPFSPLLGLFTPLVGLLLFFLSVKLWYRGLSKYQSTGS
ncbi:MAG: ABC-2 family transporter protein [Treponema sp.]|jgi:ABC-2 type transport system permease protein|nr:ABC-2 family transporter protein [Treponema sp.]